LRERGKALKELRKKKKDPLDAFGEIEKFFGRGQERFRERGRRIIGMKP